MQKDRIAFFDILRILSVSLVFLVHIFQKYNSPLGQGFGVKGFYFVSLGGIGVTFLLVLSGMALEHGLSTRNETYLEFIKKRFKRIYPLYWLSLLLTVILFGFTRLPQHGWPDYLLELSGTIVFTGRAWGGFILPTGWFIGVIVSMYLIYPIISKYMRNYGSTFLLALLLLSGISRYFAGMLENRAIDWLPLCRVFEFGLGVWIVNNRHIFKFIRGIGANFGDSRKMFLQFAGALSFPVYLIHWPLLYMPFTNHFTVVAAVPLVLFSTFATAALMLKIAQLRPPFFLLKKTQEV